MIAVYGGCAPANFVDGMAWTIHRAGVENAAFQPVQGYPALRANAFVLDRLNHVRSIKDATRARAALQQALEQAARLGRYALNNEMDRLPSSQLTKIWHRYYRDEPLPDDVRAALGERVWAQIEQRHAILESRLETARSVQAIHALAGTIRSAVKPSPKDRHGRGPLLKLVAASIKEDRRPLDRGGPLVDVYEPAGEPMCVGLQRSEVGALEDEFLSRYAPIIVQERRTDAPYDADVDRIGTVRLSGQPTRFHVLIDTKEPSVYAYWQYTWINGHKHLQLTYTHWFPAHPPFKPFDAEAGAIEGVTLRVTLDSNHKPVFFETVLNCGCFHRAYPAVRLEQATCDKYGGPLGGKGLCVERAVPGKMDWIIPEAVDVVDGDLTRPILFSRAGFHGPAGIGFSSDAFKTRNVRKKRAYTLHLYDDLERLPVGDGFGSMFGPRGLVRGAARLEGKLLAPTGMLSAGQPRQRGTQLLHWDQYDFDDPHLLETCLRLPSVF